MKISILAQRLAHIVLSLMVTAILLLPTGSRAAIQVEVSGPGGKVALSPPLPDEGGTFDVNLPLNQNAVNTLTVTATDEHGNTASQELAVTQISLDKIVVSRITSERLSVEQVQQLVNEGVIDLDDPENYNVSTFDIVLTIANEPIPVKVPIVMPKGEEETGWETYKMPRDGAGGGSNRRPPPRPVEIVVFEETVSGPGGEYVSVPGVLVIEGRIKSLKEFFSVRLLLMNTSGIFTLSDVAANIEFPDGGLTSILPADGVISFGEILPGDGDQPGQKEKEFVIRGDEIGVRDVIVNFGGLLTGPGILVDEPIPFNGSAATDVEVKGPPTFEVQVTHPESVIANQPYQLEVRITNTDDIPAMYASLELDFGADGRLVTCGLAADGSPVCTDLEEADVRSLGHILPNQTVTEIFTVRPLKTGRISSCMGASDQNITLQVFVGTIGCMVGHFPPDRVPSDGAPAVSVLPSPNATGIHTDSPVVAFFSEEMRTETITTGENGSFNVFDSARNRVPGQLRFETLNAKTVAIWQVNDGLTNRLVPNAAYTVMVTTDASDLDGMPLAAPWTSTFSTTATGIDDITPPTLTLSVRPPVNPNFVLPGQIIEVHAYASDQGTGISRVEARIKDLDEPEAVFQLIDQKTVFQGDRPPFIFSIDSAGLAPGHAYQFRGTAYDGNGNLRDATLSLLIAASAAPPTLLLPEDPADPILHGVSIDVTPVALTGGVREVRFYLDGATAPFKTVNLAPYQTSLRTLGLALGAHTVRAVAEDGLGQTGEDSLRFELVENLNMPTVGFSGAVSGTEYVEGSSILVRGTAEDPVGVQSMRYYLDSPGGEPLYTGMAPILLDTTGLSLGTHTIYLQATNNLGISNLLTDPASMLTFSIVEPPPGPPPPKPTITQVSHPDANGIVTVQGTSAPGTRVDITNTNTGVTVSVNVSPGGSFSAEIDAHVGDVLTILAYDFSQSGSPSEPVQWTATAPPVLLSIDVSPSAMNFTAANQSQNILVTGHYDDGTASSITQAASFSSSNPAVASVSQSGTVVALSYGTATVTVTVGNCQRQVTVASNIVNLTHITVSPASLHLAALGQTGSLTVTGHYSNGSSQTLSTGVSYATGNAQVATVNSAGVITAVGDGSTEISVSRSGVPPVAVTVTVDTGLDPAPTVTILSPADGSAVERSDLVTVTVRARDTLGGVTRISLNVAGETGTSQLIQVSPASLDTTKTFSFAVSEGAEVGGTIRISVQAEDTSGHSSEAASVTLNVVDETPPAVTIAQPGQQTPFNFGDTVEIHVEAVDTVGLSQIRFETTGALHESGIHIVDPISQAADAHFSFEVPYGAGSPDVRIHAYAVDLYGNEGAAIPVDILLTDADITPPQTTATSVADPGSGASALVTYEVLDGLSDLDHVQLYFRRNGIGTFNRYTGPLGDERGEYVPAAGSTGTLVFDSTRMGGDGTYELYTVGVDKAGNREPPPDDGAGGLQPDQTAIFQAGTVWTVIHANTLIGEGDAAYDDRNLRIDAATVTVDGAHSFRNVELLNGAVLTHSETTTTTAFSLEVSAWTLTVDPTSIIDVTGRGYLGGNRSGLGETAHTVGFQAGSQAGNGGSHGGIGGHYSGSGANAPNPPYGNLTHPADLGSGGGAWNGPGGDGGGRVFLGAINVIAEGSILANGGESAGSAAGDGSGGSVNITTRTLSGTGSVRADGGGLGSGTGGGGGRIAVRYLDLSTYELAGLSARGGDGQYGDGADGTIFLLPEGMVNGNLVINGVGPGSPYTDLILPPGQTFDSVTLQNGARVIAQDPIRITGTLTLTGQSVLTHPDADEAGLWIEASTVIVEAGSSIDVTGRGYKGGDLSGHGQTGSTLGYIPGAQSGNGGSYGGRGAHYNGSGGNQSNLVYGDPKRPCLLGSGGGAYSGYGGAGGGYVRIIASDEVLVDGAIRANGGESHGSAAGDGSGGSIWIATSRLAGEGTIAANGGGSGNGTGGGGGRVALHVDYVDSNSDLNGLRNVTALRGRGYYDDRRGSAGTVYMKYSTQGYGDLIIDDNIVGGGGLPNGTSPTGTPLPLIGLGESTAVTEDTLTVDGTVPLPPGGLKGLRINPDVNREDTFEILSNTGNTITVVTPNENGVNFADAAAAENTYAASWVFDNIVFRRGGHLEVGDLLHVMDTLDLKEFGLLTHPETTQAYEAQLDLVVGTLLIDGTSRIDVTGRGYLGGDRSGLGQTAHALDFQAGAQSGNGGSYGGLGGHYSGSGANAANGLYGNLTEPVDLGSGGGAYSGYGGDGGGRIFVTATDIVVEGAIIANGGESAGSAAGDGSGGTVNIRTATLSGSGILSANGGGLGNGTGGGGGRIAIRYRDAGSLTLPQSRISAMGGDGYYGDGGHGTVFLMHTGLAYGTLVIDAASQAQPPDTTSIPGGLTFDNIEIRNGAHVVADSGLTVLDTLRVMNGSVLTHSQANESGLYIEAASIVVEEGGSIDVTGRGYPGGDWSGHGQTGSTLGNLPGAQSGNGGAYGGRGAHYNGSGGNQSNLVYGDPKRPSLLGSGGGAYSGYGGGGGGLIRIVASQEVIVDGTIRANGGESAGSAAGDGSGGSIWITASRLAGDGGIRANGGGNGNGTGGGGGRIALYLDSLDAISDLNGLGNVSAFRGRGQYDDVRGSAGTVYVKFSTQEDGDLVIDDNIVDAGGAPNGTSLTGTPLPLIGFGTADAVTADTLTLDGIVSLPPNGLAGLRINPSVDQDETFAILSNTQDTITVVTPNENGVAFSDVARASDTYAGSWTFDNIVFRRGGHLEVGDLLDVADTVDLKEFGLLTHPETTTVYEARLDLEVGTLLIDAGGRIDVTGRGYLGGDRSGLGQTAHTLGLQPGALSGNGGSYGGLGGHYSGSGGNQPNPVYGSETDPRDLGSGGGAYSGYGGDGGGRVFITASDIIVNGAIIANGGESAGSAAGDGSGGTVNILTGNLAGSGSITANGGGLNSGTGGGGGRVWIDWSGTLTLPGSNIRASGGQGQYGNGANGTVRIE
jgi:hypothetical protein